MALMRHEPLPEGRFVPEPWPRAPKAKAEAVIEAAEGLPKSRLTCGATRTVGRLRGRTEVSMELHLRKTYPRKPPGGRPLSRAASCVQPQREALGTAPARVPVCFHGR